MRRTIIAQGRLASSSLRLRAAQRSESGLQIMSIERMAERLAGGFRRIVDVETLERSVKAALQAGGFAEIGPIASLPGTPRAVVRALRKAWSAGLDLNVLGRASPRAADVAIVESRVRNGLPPGMALPRDAAAAAVSRVAHAAAVLGTIELFGLLHVPRCWRPLLVALAQATTVTWRACSAADHAWLPNVTVLPLANAPAAPVSAETCADPRHEAVEAMRWARGLIASGAAEPHEVAIASAATEPWDAHFLALAADSQLQLHFSHGAPALSTFDGQRCGALADLLLRGLSQTRMRRLLRVSGRRCRALQNLPEDWAKDLPADAALLSPVHWRRALERLPERADGVDLAAILLPVVDLVARGPSAAEEAGASLLDGRASDLWSDALRCAPPEALALSLADLRVDDGREPGASVVWAPAAHLSAFPRRFVRLIGLTSRGWPRHAAEDPILPGHVVGSAILDPDPVAAIDRMTFDAIRESASGALVLSRSRRDQDGRLLGRSPLVPPDLEEVHLERTRIPEHAFSETDRLLARAAEFSGMERARSAARCWRNWRTPEPTPHDGLLRPDHPVIARALTRVHSATSLRKLLRDPLGFVWEYALGWRTAVEGEEPLTLDDPTFGELVHEILGRAVDRLQGDGGLAAADEDGVSRAIAATVAEIREDWPLERPTPPPLIWQAALERASRLAETGVRLEAGLPQGIRSWTEVPFGGSDPDGRVLPWDCAKPVEIPGTGIKITGRIDRLDLTTDGAARLTDYKTGRTPKDAAELRLNGGAELQRCLYSLAVRALLPDVAAVEARLAYLGEAAPGLFPLDDEASCLEVLARHLVAARDLLRSGVALPGLDALDDRNPAALALPCNAKAAYFALKQRGFDAALSPLATLWEER